MTTITTRSGKGSPLTNNEVDANFTNLNDDKVEASGDSMTGDLSFGDNNKAIFGAGSDLQIYHDGTDSYVDDQGTGRLRLRGASQIILEHPTNGETYAAFQANGASTLYYDNAAKLATTSTGIDVTGTAVTDGVTVAGNILLQTEGNELQFNTSSTPVNKIYSDDTYTSNGLTISADNGVALKSTNNYLLLDDTGTNEMVLNVDSGERMRVTSTGIDVTGTVTADDITLSDTDTPTLTLTDTTNTVTNIVKANNSIGTVGTSTANDLYIQSNDTVRQRVRSNGDIAWYNDAASSQDLYWDASTSRLGLGTTSPDALVQIGAGARTANSSTFAATLLVGDRPNGDGNATIDFSPNLTTGNGVNLSVDSSKNINFYDVSSGVYTSRLKIDSSGNVGIGTTAPAYELDVNSTIHIGNDGGSSYTHSRLILDSNGATRAAGIFSHNQVNDTEWFFGSPYDTPDSFAINRLATASHSDSTANKTNSLVTVNSSGNVGIGTSDLTDSYKTIIEGSDQETANLTDSGTHGATLFLRATGEDVGSGGAVAFGTTNGNKRPFAAIKGYVLDGTANSVGDLVFSTRATTSATALTERMTLTKDGRLVIGDNSPQAKLDVQSDGQYTPAGYFRNNGDTLSWARADWYNNQASGTGIVYRDSSGSFIFRNDNSSGTAMTTALVAGGTTAGNIVFNTTSSAEAARIDSSGNLLVGKTAVGVATDGFEARASGLTAMSDTSGAALNVNRNSTDGALAYFYKDGTTVGQINARSGDLVIGTGTTGLQFYDVGNAIFPLSASGNTNRDAAIDLGETSNRFKDLYLSGTAYSAALNVDGGSSGIINFGDVTSNYGRLYADSTGTYVGSVTANPLIFRTTNTERARIDSSGNLLVGTTESLGTGGLTVRPDITQGAAQINFNRATTTNTSFVVVFQDAGTDVGSISYSNTVVAYNTTSDQRLKENIVDAPSASDDIDAIQVRSFDWKADGSHQKYGMVAQELQTVAPEAVTIPDDPEEMAGVDYSKLVPMMLKEIQSLRARVAQLEGAN